MASSNVLVSPERVRVDLRIYEGKGFAFDFRWATTRILYKTITGATKAAPCVLTAISHGLPNGWPFRVSNVGGMGQLNLSAGDGSYTAKVIDADHIEINNLNSLEFGNYTSGGVVYYQEPLDLAGYSAKMQIRPDWDSATVFFDLSNTNGGIVIDNVAKTVTVTRTAVQTQTLAWERGVYDIELINPAGVVVSPVPYGSVTVKNEATMS